MKLSSLIPQSMILISTVVFAATPPPKPILKWTDKLAVIRSKSSHLEQELIQNLKTQKEASTSVKKIRVLLDLQRQEQVISRARIAELEDTVGSLERRRGEIREKILLQQRNIRHLLVDFVRAQNETPELQRRAKLTELERVSQARSKLLGQLSARSLREIEEYRADLIDSDQLELKINEEKQQLAYGVQELEEQKGVLELNRQLQADLIQKRHQDRIGQLENYRKLKDAESQVEQLMNDFSARMELEKAVESERLANLAVKEGGFIRLRGRLPLPAKGSIVGHFGRSFDLKSQMHVFKKGIDIAVDRDSSVKAVAPGKVAFVGVMPGYGNLAIIDHGNHYYSLCAKLGQIVKKTGDKVEAGEILAQSDDAGTPVYFEIRARNVAVNPLQWIAN